MQKFLCMILLAIAVLAAPKPAYADIASGTYDNVSWRITDDAELILGNGGTQTMTYRDSRDAGNYPWNNQYMLTKKISVNGTVKLRGSVHEMFYHWPGSGAYHDTTGYTKLEYADISGLDFSEVTNIEGLFLGAKKLETVILPENFNLQNTTRMRYAFAGCSALKNMEITNINTSKATEMQYMFYNCSNLTNLNVSGFNTSNVTNMTRMFYGCSNLTSLDVSHFNTGKVTDMSFMFYDCQKLKTLDVSNWNTGNVRNMGSLFRNCYIINGLDVSGFNTSKVTSFDMMFDYCYKLTPIDVSRWNTSSATNFARMFRHCESITELNLSNFNTARATTIRTMFESCKSLTSLDLSSFNTANVTDMSWTFANLSSMKELDLSNFNTSRVTLMEHTFRTSTALERLDISSWDTQKVTSMLNFFMNTKALKEVKLGNGFTFKGSNITNVSNQALLLKPTESQYTGKWIREDGAEGPFTPEELREIYITNPGKYAGTWVWEEKPNGTLVYRSPGPEYTGAMPSQSFFTEEDFALAANNFHRPGYIFSHWKVIKVNDAAASQELTFVDCIPANTFEAGDTVELQAVLTPRNSDVELKDGTFDFVLMAGERIDFKDIPGGAKYQIWEETPDGWVLVNQTNAAGEIIPTKTIESAFINKYIPGTATIQLYATKTLDSHAPEANAFSFDLLDENDLVIETATNNEAGVVQFETLSFTAPGTYTYKIREEHGNNHGIQYDSHTEIITVEVVDHDGVLVATSSLGDTMPSFVNHTKPGTLKISKSTDGKGTGNEEFTFEVKLTNEFGQSLDSISAFTETSKE